MTVRFSTGSILEWKSFPNHPPGRSLRRLAPDLLIGKRAREKRFIKPAHNSITRKSPATSLLRYKVAIWAMPKSPPSKIQLTVWRKLPRQSSKAGGSDSIICCELHSTPSRRLYHRLYIINTPCPAGCTLVCGDGRANVWPLLRLSLL